MRLPDGSHLRDDFGDAAQPPADWIHGRVAERLHAATQKAAPPTMPIGYSIGGKANTNQDGSIAVGNLSADGDAGGAKSSGLWAGVKGWLKDAAKSVLGFAVGGQARNPDGTYTGDAAVTGIPPVPVAGQSALGRFTKRVANAVTRTVEKVGHAAMRMIGEPEGFATGGNVGGDVATGGAVQSTGFATGSSNGSPQAASPTDTVPALLTPGEVVLNKGQQGRLESITGTPAAKLFGMAGVPGFAGGGTVGSDPAGVPANRNFYRELLGIDTDRKPSPHELIGSQPGQFDKAEYLRRVQHVKGYASHDNYKHPATAILNEMAAARLAVESGELTDQPPIDLSQEKPLDVTDQHSSFAKRAIPDDVANPNQARSRRRKAQLYKNPLGKNANANIKTSNAIISHDGGIPLDIPQHDDPNVLPNFVREDQRSQRREDILIERNARLAEFAANPTTPAVGKELARKAENSEMRMLRSWNRRSDTLPPEGPLGTSGQTDFGKVAVPSPVAPKSPATTPVSDQKPTQKSLADLLAELKTAKESLAEFEKSLAGRDPKTITPEEKQTRGKLLRENNDAELAARHADADERSARKKVEEAKRKPAVEQPSLISSAVPPGELVPSGKPVGLVDPHPEVGSFGKPAGGSTVATSAPTKLGPDVDWNALTPQERKYLRKNQPELAEQLQAASRNRQQAAQPTPTFASQATPSVVSSPATPEVLPTLERDPNGTDVIPTLKPADPKKWATTGKNADGSDSGLGQQPINPLLSDDSATSARSGKQQTRHPLIEAVLSVIPGHVGRAARSAWSTISKGAGSGGPVNQTATASAGGSVPPVPPTPTSPSESAAIPVGDGSGSSVVPPSPTGATKPGEGVMHVWVDGGQINVANWPGASSATAASAETSGTPVSGSANSGTSSPTSSRRRSGGRSPRSRQHRESLNDSLTGKAVRGAFKKIASTKLGKQFFASAPGRVIGKTISGLARATIGRVGINSTLGGIVGGPLGSAGGIAGSLIGGTAGAAIGGVATGAGAAIAFGKAINDAANALRGFAQTTAESNRSLGTYNGSIAAAFAKLDSQRIRREKEVGAFTSGSNRALTKAVNEAEEARQPLRALGMQTDNILGVLGAKIATGLDTIILRLAAVGQLFKIVSLIESYLPKSKDPGFSPAEQMAVAALGGDPGGIIKQGQQGRAAKIDEQVAQAERDGQRMLLNWLHPGAGDLLFRNQKEAEAGKKPFNPAGRNR